MQTNEEEDVGQASRHIAALLAAGAGFYVGLIVGVASLGLSGGADMAPLLSSTFGGLIVGVVLGFFDGRRHMGSRTAVGLASGLLVGLICWLAEPELEWCVGGVGLLSQILAWHSWAR